MNLHHSDKTWELLQSLVTELLAPNSVEVCGVEVIEEKDGNGIMNIELCYDVEKAKPINPKLHTRLIFETRRALLDNGTNWFPYFRHNIPENFVVSE